MGTDGQDERSELGVSWVPAILGGTPCFPEGPPTWPRNSEGVRAALEQVWRDGDWGRYEGPWGRRLCERLAQIHNVEQVLLCSSGTIAVELALRGLGVVAGDEVILAGYDFPGNFRAIEAIGARPVLVDLAADGWNLDAGELDAAYSPRTKAVLVSHLHRSMAPLPLIQAWAHSRGVQVLEDACQNPGGRVAGRVAGSWGDASVLSFGGSKLLTAGRGGAVLTRRADVFQRMKISNDRGNLAYPLSELQAAAIVPQLDELSELSERRRTGVERLDRALAGAGGLSRGDSMAHPDDAPTFYKASWFVESSLERGFHRERLITAARAEGIALDAGFRGFAGRGGQRCRKIGGLPRSRRAAEQTVLLHHPVLLSDAGTLDRVAAVLRALVEFHWPSTT